MITRQLAHDLRKSLELIDAKYTIAELLRDKKELLQLGEKLALLEALHPDVARGNDESQAACAGNLEFLKLDMSPEAAARVTHE